MSTKSRRPKRAWQRTRRRTPPGTAPGTITIDPSAPRPLVEVLAYNHDQFFEQRLEDLDKLPEILQQWPVVWINVAGLGDATTLSRMGEIFGLHQLALEDVANSHQRAKLEDYQDHLFLVARAVHLRDHLETEQFSIFLGKNFVVMFQEEPGDCFDPVRQRIRADRGIIRSQGPDYLAYTLLDAVIDSYFPVLEQYSDRIEAIDDAIADHHPNQTISRIHDLRTELLGVRRAIWPHRELVNALVRDPHSLIQEPTRLYLRDCFDHTVQIIDLVETYREMCSDLTDYAMTTVGNRLNEIMKVLTIIATIFIPLSFIAGLYGMNFSPDHSPWNMPELRWYYGYPFALSLMAAVAGGLLSYFWYKGWIGASWRSYPGLRGDRVDDKDALDRSEPSAR